MAEAAELLGESVTAYLEIRDFQRVHVALVDLALLALEADRTERSARLLGAATAFPNHPIDAYESAPLPAGDDAAAERVRSLLGAGHFDTGYAAGTALSWDVVLAEIDAVTTHIHDLTEAPFNPTTEHGLTRREAEVLCLLAEGRSNRAIAEALSLSERTVENHVLHILTKPDLDSRTAAATYAVRHGLA